MQVLTFSSDERRAVGIAGGNETMKNDAIGVFDSGMGGLTTVKELHAILPHENIIYFGDTARIPYGSRSPETILRYAREDVAFLQKHAVKMIIAACGTVSSVVGDSPFVTDLPFTGVVLPAAETACAATRNGKIGIIGTSATIKSGSYEKAIHTTDIRDIADLQYTAYRIEAQARNFEKATEKIHHYIYLTDSLTRSNMQFSAGMVERDYFKERSNFAEYRMKNRTIWEIAVASVIFLILGVAYYIIRQRLRLQRERTDHYLLLAEEANSQYKTLTEHMEGQRNAESYLKGLVASRFDIIDKLGKTYYERENTASQQAAMFHEVKQIITDFAENNAMFQELELIVNTCHDNAMEKLRNDFPSMKEADIRLLCYIFVGFSPQVISLFMKDTVANVYARKSRLKSRIKSAETANKELFLALFG